MTGARGGPRSRKGTRTRTRLLEAAQAVFEERGYQDTRVSDIAEAADLSHASFYHYFDSKEQVFRELAEHHEAQLTAPAEPDDESARPDVSELAKLWRANRLYLERYGAAGHFMGVIEEVSRYDDQVNATRIQRQKHFAERAERSIRRLQDAGLADPAVDAELAALALGSMVGRFAELWLVEGWGDYELDHAADQITRLWANAIGLREA